MANRKSNVIAGLVLLAVSTAVALLACEVIARLTLHSADYLSVEMVPDPALGAVISPESRPSGFDSAGFRNKSVPERADIVALGDSHTYGNTATTEQSWPYVLGQLSGKSVYNLGMGGYGPNQYLYLLQKNALPLKPHLILCGLYMGDDFENAYSITYGLDYWKSYRTTQVQNANYAIWDSEPAATSWDKQGRLWLSRHSVLYQVVFHGPLMGLLQGEIRIKNAAKTYPGVVTTLEVPDKHILEAFRPAGLDARLDQSSPAVNEGMRITFELLRQMKLVCDQNQVQFVVIVIPTKEQVFSDYLEHNPKLPMHSTLDNLIENERSARDKTFRTLAESGIPYVDTLPSLKASLSKELYARTPADMHPNKNGYRVIAEAVSKALVQQKLIQ